MPASTGCSPSASAVGWQTYRDAAATDPDIAADWQRLSEMRRDAFHALLARIPDAALRPGLSPALAADTAWAIASPETHHQLVRQAGYSYDDLESWVREHAQRRAFPRRVGSARRPPFRPRAPQGQRRALTRVP